MFLTRTNEIKYAMIITFPLFMGIDRVMYAGPIADIAALLVTVGFARSELSKMKRIEE